MIVVMSVNDEGNSKRPKRRRRSAATLEPVQERTQAADEVEVEVRDDGLHIGLVVRWPDDVRDEWDVGDAFVEESRRLLHGQLPDEAVARRAARIATAEQAWAMRLGTLFDARDVDAHLNVSKQRVSTLTKEQRLLALPVGGRLRYPAWQFAGLTAEGRVTLVAAHREMVDVGGIDPWSAADWATHPHPDLGGADPVSWLREGGAGDQVIGAARRDAGRAAQ